MCCLECGVNGLVANLINEHFPKRQSTWHRAENIGESQHSDIHGTFALSKCNLLLEQARVRIGLLLIFGIGVAPQACEFCGVGPKDDEFLYAGLTR